VRADGALTLVLVAHPDDEVLGMAGVIARAVREGRPLTVAIATDGNAWGSYEEGRRNAESLAGLALLGVPPEDVVFLGFPDGALNRLPRFRGRRRFAQAVAGLVGRASVVYTHVPFDGHGDHVAVADQVLAAAGPGTEVLGALMHPPGAGECLELSASRWPGPAGDPAVRFRPHEELEPPPSPACAEHPPERSWGPRGAPDVRLEVPEDMQSAEEGSNLKWQAIACHGSQVDISPVSAGYLRGFVRREELFWRLAP
jgi:LmbE family N-acetylglucosaminyl deacetylase